MIYKIEQQFNKIYLVNWIRKKRKEDDTSVHSFLRALGMVDLTQQLLPLVMCQIRLVNV